MKNKYSLAVFIYRKSICFITKRIPAPLEETIRIMISVMGDHVYTTAMDKSTTALVQQLHKHRFAATAEALQDAAKQLQATVGKLNSRSTRV